MSSGRGKTLGWHGDERWREAPREKWRFIDGKITHKFRIFHSHILMFDDRGVCALNAGTPMHMRHGDNGRSCAWHLMSGGVFSSFLKVSISMI